MPTTPPPWRARRKAWEEALRTLRALSKNACWGGPVLPRVQVVVPPDPGLVDHMLTHGVAVDVAALSESQRLGKAFTAQLLRYTAPFMFISAVFWLLHTWLLDPMPNAFRCGTHALAVSLPLPLRWPCCVAGGGSVPLSASVCRVVAATTFTVCVRAGGRSSCGTAAS